ncbi:unnamed protein product [Gemmata massiliana]|uniref:Lipoprotein n=1 Tax=Gemmata massiliana TaxID=1210884 RepID=A0A6P2CPM4_9BACT|nr:hypothetical protein [Gemmata massiliana]VTR90968.1 unnamed protein product [Gemmata massiliana]
MIVPLTSRRAAAMLLAVLLGLTALPGCGGSTPQAEKKDDKKEDPKKGPDADPKKGDADPKKGPSTIIEPKSVLGPVEPDADKMAMTFLKDLGQGIAKADALSSAFLKDVGKPLELPDDIKNGVSTDAATRWLKYIGEGYAFSLALDRQQAGDVVILLGQVNGRQLPPAGGGYSLRLIKDAGAWKVDALAITSAEFKGRIATGAADAALQEFAATLFVELLADSNGMEPKNRAPALAHAMVPALRVSWAPPFEGDTKQGYDYSTGKLTVKATEYGGGTKEFSVSKIADLTFSAELTKPSGKRTVVVKLVKGTTPGEWLVSEVSEARK